MHYQNHINSLYGFFLFWSPMLCNSWLVQWQSVDGGSCCTLQGIVSIVFAGGCVSILKNAL
jgi:hypothetical protein